MKKPVDSVGADHNIRPFTALADLASARVGGRAIACSDDFFAPRSNLVKPEPAIFIAGRFTPRGKWMDGWESRRRRTPGHDWCVVALGTRGIVHGVNVDTSYFTGNYPSHCSIEAADVRRAPSRSLLTAEGPPWVTILGKSPLLGNADNLFSIVDDRPWTHVRLNIFPDGGVARLRVYGEVAAGWARAARAGQPLDLALITNGGLVLATSDMHFGAHGNMIMPGRAKNMGDGWETRRRRGPGHDWAIVRLGAPASVSRVEIDTNHFKGNYPESASLEGCNLPGAPVDALQTASWRDILPKTKLGPDKRHLFDKQLARIGAVSHVRLNIFPDGGISRLRVYGTVAKA